MSADEHVTTIASRKDFRVDTFRGTGPGGQKRNKTESAVRITHIPTGMSEQSDETTSQHRNKSIAFRKLADRVVRWYHGEKVKLRYVSGTERVRTYHEPRDTVTDDASGTTYSYRETVGKGDLSGPIEARRNAKLGL